jgi:rare lipoprotein A (peptidoglycan hydrolase)
MRPSFAAALAAVALVGLTALPGAAAADYRGRDNGYRFSEDGSSRFQFLPGGELVERTEARPRRRTYQRWEAPRRAQRAQVRSAKRARRQAHRHTRHHRRVVQRPARGVAGGSGLVGMASFYGGRFHGRLTASGARFNQNGLTAAHRSLPFGTRVRVTHLGSGRSVDVRINDRGPFVGGRIIDLSHGAAGVLGMHGQGVARVQVTVLGR